MFIEIITTQRGTYGFENLEFKSWNNLFQQQNKFSLQNAFSNFASTTSSTVLESCLRNTRVVLHYSTRNPHKLMKTCKSSFGEMLALLTNRFIEKLRAAL